MLTLNEQLFPEWAVNETAKAFSEITKVLIRRTDGYIECSFSHNRHDPEVIEKEFENYLIALVSRRRKER